MIDSVDRAERYLILVEGGPPSNYSAQTPDLPGCVATGDDVDECAQNLREAIALHLEGLADACEPVPEPSPGRACTWRTPPDATQEPNSALPRG